MTRTVTFQEAEGLTGQVRHWAYNSADAAGTRAVRDSLLPRLHGRRQAVFRFQMAIQNVAFAITRRGIRVDQERRKTVITLLEDQIEAALAAVNEHPIVRAFWDSEEKETGACPTPTRKDGKHKWSKPDEAISDVDERERARACGDCGAPRIRPVPFNANSSAQVQRLLYDLLNIPPQLNKKGEVSGDEEVLERIAQKWHSLAPRDLRKRFPEGGDLIGWEPNEAEEKEGSGILHVRSLKKQLGEVKAPLSADGRYMTTINIAAAWCVTGDHEVLTREGWCRIDAWDDKTQIMVGDGTHLWFDEADRIKFSGVHSVVSVDSNRVSLLATPEHRMPWRQRWNGKVVVARANEGKRLDGILAGGAFEEATTTAWRTRIVVATQADGAIKHNKIQFRFRKERKIARLRSLLEASPLSWSTGVHGDGATWFRVDNAPAWMREAKTFGPWCLSHDPATFVDELVHWDGTGSPIGSVVYSTRRSENAAWAATMAHLCGRFASVSKLQNRVYKVHISVSQLGVVHPWEYSRAIAEDGVYCATTKPGFFLVRRHGKIHLTGNTGRASSSKSPRKLGGNTQNKSERIRPVFIADPGYELANADLMQAESLDLAYEAECEPYIRAHDEDLHTYVTRLIFPGLPWTGDMATDKQIAKTSPPWDSAPGHNYRWYTKRNCFADHCKLLTPGGWRRVDEIDDQTAVASWAPDDTVKFEVPTGWTREPFAGDLVHLEGRNLKTTVTPNHRLPYINNGVLRERTAGNKPNSGRFPVNGILDTGMPKPMARLRAAVWADGSHPNQGGTHQTVFSFRKERKINRLRGLLEAADLDWREVPATNGTAFTVFAKLEKALTWDLLSWDLESRRAFLDELPHWDGDQELRVFNSDLDGLEIIQAVAHVSGWAATIAPHVKPRENEKQTWVVHLRERHHGDWSRVTSEAVPYDGIVYCPTVSTGWLLTREGSTVSVVGNSHGYGYGVSPQGTARIVHGKVADAVEAHRKIDEAFPCIKDTYHARLQDRVRRGLPIVTPLGREIRLMGRPWDQATFRQAYSASPQATVSDLVWIAGYHIYRDHDPHLIQILGNGYDALLMQWRPEDREEALKAVVEAMEIPVDMPGGRTMTIGVEVSVGKNWGKYNKHTNPDGQKEIYP